MPQPKPKADTWGAGCLRIVAYGCFLIAGLFLWGVITGHVYTSLSGPVIFLPGLAAFFGVLGLVLMAISAQRRRAQERKENPPP